MKYDVHDVIRIPNGRGYRIWKVTAVILGGVGQESHYQLKPLDLSLGSNVDGKNTEALIPAALLDSHPSVECV